MSKSSKLKSQLKSRSEYEEQCAVFQWARMYEKRHPPLQLLYGSINGVKLNIVIARKAKAAGFKRGFPDLILPYPAGKYHGLFIELKRLGRSNVTKEQQWFLQTLAALDYSCHVCKGSDAAIRVICRYLDIKQ